jgi:hypothetical protein
MNRQTNSPNGIKEDKSQAPPLRKPPWQQQEQEQLYQSVDWMSLSYLAMYFTVAKMK